MKSPLLFILSILSVSLFSQSLSINPQEYYFAAQGETCSASFDVINESDQDLNVMVSKNIEFDYDITTYFCWGPICYTPSTNISNTPISIPAGSSFNGFTGYVQGMPESSTFVINYCFFPENNPLERVCADVNFTSTSLYIHEEEKLKVFPNPAHDMLYVENMGVSNFVIYNRLGLVVHNQFIDNHKIIDVSGLETGFYFYSIHKKDLKPVFRPLIINH